MEKMGRRKLSIAIAIGALAALLPLGAVNRAQAAGNALFDHPCSSGGATGDFNNDGKPDLAVGAPTDGLEQSEVDGSVTKGVTGSGSIDVVYSDASGLSASLTPSPSTPRFFSQNTPGIVDGAETNDGFGYSLAAGNFDGVGGTDLAVGVPGENGTGAVQILYSGGFVKPQTPAETDHRTIGLAGGVPGTSAYNKVFTQDTPDVEGVAQQGDRFGYAVAAGDLNGDGFSDLIIGVPGEDVGTVRDAGTIQVIYGSPHGLDPKGPSGGGKLADQVFEQGPGLARTPEVGRAEAGDFFGASLAVGEFNVVGSGADVAVGAPGEDIASKADAGSVKVLYSRGVTGLSNISADYFSQQTPFVDGVEQTGARFGCSLAGGDFDGDHESDLAIGIPGASVGKDAAAGVVSVIYNSGQSTGLSVDPNTAPPAGSFWTDNQVWTEDEGGIPGVAKPNDRLGASLAVANFDGLGPQDLAIGLPTETIFAKKSAGSVRVIYGFTGAGLTDATNTSGASPGSAFAQSPSDLGSSCPLYGAFGDVLKTPTCLSGPPDYSPLLMVEEEGDLFGASLAAADFNGDGKGDISIGAPGEDLGLVVNWLTEEEATIPDELLTDLGVKVPLSVDEASDAGVLNIVYGPFPTPSDIPNHQDVIYRTGSSSFTPLRNFLHRLPIFPDRRIPVPADKSYTKVIAGDGFGASQS